jgi:hypothetical protein
MKSERPKQQLPGEIIHDLMGVIRGAFYPGDDRWFADQHFIRRHVVTWPAAWLVGKGVTLKPERYKEIVLGVIQGIKRHGQTGVVKYWPGYLKHCLQMHFKVHGDEIYEEAKSLRTALDNALLACKRGEGDGPDPIEVIAAARRIKTPGRPARGKVKAGKQLEFL